MAFACSAHLDAAWHALLLHPKMYRNVCDALCGAELLDHDPAAGIGEHGRAQRAQRLAHTKVAYAREYGEAPPAVLWSDYDDQDDFIARPPAACRSS